MSNPWLDIYIMTVFGTQSETSDSKMTDGVDFSYLFKREVVLLHFTPLFMLPSAVAVALGKHCLYMPCICTPAEAAKAILFYQHSV